VRRRRKGCVCVTMALFTTSMIVVGVSAPRCLFFYDVQEGIFRAREIVVIAFFR
jgi:hypothetical protein